MSKENIYGLIGYGYFGKILAKALQENGLKLETICDSGLPNLPPLENLLQNKEINCAIVSTNPESHFEIIKKCLEAKKNTWAEKPLTLKSKEAAELVNLAKQNNVLLFCDLTFLYSRESDFIKTQLNNFRFGEVLSANFKWAANGKIQDCGVCADLLVHPLSQIIHFFGYPQYLQAVGGHLMSNIVFKYGGRAGRANVNVFCELSWVSPNKVRKCEITTDRGLLTCNYDEDLSFVFLDGKYANFARPDSARPLNKEFTYFDNQVKYSDPRNIDYTNAYTASFIVEVTEKVIESMNNGGREIGL